MTACPVDNVAPTPWMTAPGARAVLDALAAEGAAVRFVGGAVRDALLGHDVADIDLGTPDPPERVMELLERAGIRGVPTGIAHGTVTALAGDKRYEITTLRRDLRTDGRHAEVAFTDDWRADAARRDFTINAMSCTAAGMLHDYFGGRRDLEAGRVRFVGDAAARIAEDRLRLLRFFRFHAWYGAGAPDAAALAACAAAARTVRVLSGERVRGEMLKLLAADYPVPALTAMGKAGVLAEVLPGARGTGRLAGLMVAELDDGVDVDPVRRLGALVSDAADPIASASAVADCWRLSKAEGARLAALAAPPLVPKRDLDRCGQRRALYQFGYARFCDLVLLAWAAHAEENGAFWAPLLETADARDDLRQVVRGEEPAGRGLLAAIKAEGDFEPDHATAREERTRRFMIGLIRTQWERKGKKFRAMLETADEWEEPRLPVRGADALALGVEAGPAVGRLLTAVEAWWIARDFAPDRAAALERLAALVAESREA